MHTATTITCWEWVLKMPFEVFSFEVSEETVSTELVLHKRMRKSKYSHKIYLCGEY
jgi:hypothetical protein